MKRRRHRTLVALIPLVLLPSTRGHATEPFYGQAVVVQVHASWFGYRHVSLRLEPSNPEAWANHPSFRTDQKTGRLFATLGAQSRKIRGKLVAKPNRRTDRRNHKTEVVPVDLDGRREQEVIADLLAAESSYGDDARYRAFPKPSRTGYNSNSFVSGLLRTIGLDPPKLESHVPGYNVPIPRRYFGVAKTDSNSPNKTTVASSRSRALPVPCAFFHPDPAADWVDRSPAMIPATRSWY